MCIRDRCSDLNNSWWPEKQTRSNKYLAIDSWVSNDQDVLAKREYAWLWSTTSWWSWGNKIGQLTGTLWLVWPQYLINPNSSTKSASYWIPGRVAWPATVSGSSAEKQHAWIFWRIYLMANSLRESGTIQTLNGPWTISCLLYTSRCV